MCAHFVETEDTTFCLGILRKIGINWSLERIQLFYSLVKKIVGTFGNNVEDKVHNFVLWEESFFFFYDFIAIFLHFPVYLHKMCTHKILESKGEIYWVLFRLALFHKEVSKWDFRGRKVKEEKSIMPCVYAKRRCNKNDGYHKKKFGGEEARKKWNIIIITSIITTEVVKQEYIIESPMIIWRWWAWFNLIRSIRWNDTSLEGVKGEKNEYWICTEMTQKYIILLR